MPSAPHPETPQDQNRSGGAGSGGDSQGASALGAGRAHELLLAAVEHHALPRLLAAHGGRRYARKAGGSPLSAERPQIRPKDIETLLACVATPDFQLAEAALLTVARRGFTRAELLVGLLAPAARRLHARWREDRETFAAVALATGRLQRLIRSDAMPASDEKPTPSGGAVLVSGRPEDPRPFDAAVAADFFRAAQWDAECLTPRTEQDLADRLKARSFDCLALVWSSEAGTGGEDGFVRRMRRASANPRLIVLLSGLPAGCGADERLGADAAVEHAAGLAPIASNLLMSRVA
jgi:hypothetical protein